mmetsp:Transcript_76261/g.150835  ORF Transcript_76261/g.150835 Transcript_76261/m.150835 type:complete len:629 (+) Transcript_76261:169-2055(+)
MGTRQSCMSHPCMPGSAAALAALNWQDEDAGNREALVQVTSVPVLDKEQQAQEEPMQRSRRYAAITHAARISPRATSSTKQANSQRATSRFRCSTFCLEHTHKVVGLLGVVIFLGIGIIILVKKPRVVHTTTTTTITTSTFTRTSTTTFTTFTHTSTPVAANGTADEGGTAANAGSHSGRNEANVTSGEVTVLIWMTVQNVDYTKLTADPRLLERFQVCIQSTLAKQAASWLIPGTMQLGLKPGSVRVDVTARARDGHAADKWRTKEGQGLDLEAKLSESVNDLPGLSAVCTGTPAVNDVGLAVQNVQGPSWTLPVSVFLVVCVLFCALPVICFGGLHRKKRKDGYVLAKGDTWLSDLVDSTDKVEMAAADIESNPDDEAVNADASQESLETSRTAPGEDPVPGQGVFAAAAAAAQSSPLVVVEGKGSGGAAAASEAATGGVSESSTLDKKPPDSSSEGPDSARLEDREPRSDSSRKSERKARNDKSPTTPRSASSLSDGSLLIRASKDGDSSRSHKSSSKPRKDDGSGSGRKSSSSRRSGSSKDEPKEKKDRERRGQRSPKPSDSEGDHEEKRKKPQGNPEVDYFRMAVERGFSVTYAKETLAANGGNRTAAYKKLCREKKEVSFTA